MNKSRNNSHNRKISNINSTNKKVNQPYNIDYYTQNEKNQRNISQF
jgi:hypothetical protein